MLLFFCAGCATAPEVDELAIVAEMMTGSFSSEAQAAEDESYFDIRLEMVPIWTDRTDGPWLYVEQAAASALDRPYRQRVYHLAQNEAGNFVSTVYEFPEPLDHAGAWKEEAPLTSLSPDDLTLREGCAVVLSRVGDRHYSGSTVDKECLSSLRGASYATSEVIVTDAGIESWDRGYDAEDQQVWGAEAGAYVFVRSPSE